MTTTADTNTPGSATLAPPPTAALPVNGRAALPEIDPEPNGTFERVLTGVFVAVPMLALLAAVPLAWGWGLGWREVVIAVVFYAISGLGISMGFHRYFTHGSFKATRGFKIALAVAGTPGHRGTAAHLGRRSPQAPQVQRQGRRPALALAVRHRLEGADQGPGLRPHRLAVRHQPHLAGEVLPGLARRRRHRQDLPAVPLAGGGLAAGTALIGGLWTWSWQGAVIAFFWASLVRVAFLHHVTWSINSICHTFGKEAVRGPRQVAERELAGDPLLRRVLAQPAPRRPDVRQARGARGQIDIAARLIWVAENSAGSTTSAGRTRRGSPRNADRQLEEAGLHDQAGRDQRDWLTSRPVDMMGQ